MNSQLVERVRRVFLTSQQNSPEFTFGMLLERVEPTSPDELALVLAKLTTAKFVERIFRVESPESHGGIGDFSSLSEIPQEIHDWRTNRTVEVHPENLVVIFRAGPEAQKHG